MNFDFFAAIRDFLDAGGEVLFLIMLTTLALWTLIAERFLFYKKQYPKFAKNIISKWNERMDRKSWKAHREREAIISQVSMELSHNIPFIKTLVALCPLLGLLGTVTGMIAVFDVMALTGTGNARMMASGISMATIPTMAGMVAALSGLYFGSQLENKAETEKAKLTDQMLIK